MVVLEQWSNLGRSLTRQCTAEIRLNATMTKSRHITYEVMMPVSRWKWTWYTGRHNVYSDHVRADLHIERCKSVDRTFCLVFIMIFEKYIFEMNKSYQKPHFSQIPKMRSYCETLTCGPHAKRIGFEQLFLLSSSLSCALCRSRWGG